MALQDIHGSKVHPGNTLNLKLTVIKMISLKKKSTLRYKYDMKGTHKIAESKT